MALSTEDMLLGHALRYLYDGKENAAAELLFQCKLEVAPGTSWDSRHITIVGPRSAYDVITSILPNAKGRAIKHAIEIALPAVDGRAPSVEWRCRASSVFRDPVEQAELLQLARGLDTPGGVVEALTIKPEQRPLLVTPIPIFTVTARQRDPSLCFVIMPFAAHFQPIYSQGIQPAVQAAGLRCQRGDDITRAGDIMTQVWDALLRADVVVADLTGVNGNVFYELGLAHVLGHQVILLTQRRDDVPFDLRSQRYIEYAPTPVGLRDMRAKLEIFVRLAHDEIRS